MDDEKLLASSHMSTMSRAFVNEDSVVQQLPDRPISEHPNLVTERGLALIEKQLETARREYGEAQAAGDREALAKAGRDLRYWNARRTTAQVRAPEPATGTVQFGNKVTIARDDGRTQSFRIVGEDEADPARGSVSYVSPLARALLGKHVGDTITAGRAEAEISAVE